MKAEQFLKGLTSEEVYDRIANPQEYPYSSFLLNDFEDWLMLVDEEAYRTGYQAGEDNA